MDPGPSVDATASVTLPGGWETVNQPVWTQGSLPVFFFYGASWCPYCSASSWSVYAALSAFGNFSGSFTLGYSSTSDVYPATPEILLGGVSYSSSWVALQWNETFPTLTNSTGVFYFNTYGGNSIPFAVIDGQYVNANGTLVDPAGLVPWEATGASTVLSEVNSRNGSAWNVIASQTFLIEALLVVANGGNGPAAVLSSANVTADLALLGYYPVSFTESGLPSGASWSVTLDGVTKDSSTSAISLYRTDGRYPFTVGVVEGYVPSPDAGNVTVSGTGQSVSVSFVILSVGKYVVTFVESGLPAGTNWTVTMNGTVGSSTDTTNLFIEPDGIYAFVIGKVAGYNSSPVAGNLTVNGSNVTESIAFTLIPGNNPLTASASASPTTVQTGQAVTFTCAASGGEAPYSYSWAFGDGGAGAGLSTTHDYTLTGTMNATCTVTDSFGTAASGSAVVTVTSSSPSGTGSSGGCSSGGSGSGSCGRSTLSSGLSSAEWTFVVIAVIVVATLGILVALQRKPKAPSGSAEPQPADTQRPSDPPPTGGTSGSGPRS